MADGRKLSGEDCILWGKVARSTRPMPGRMDELYELEAEMTAILEAREKANETSKPAQVSSPEEKPAQKPVSRHHPLERPVKKKLSRGKLALEARLDLHGLVQSEAHALLHSFLVRAHERGLRHVLVITGKGSSMGSDGALKRAVPMWFAKPDFRPLISSYETAAQNHGGEGALYIRLSRVRGEDR
ncbi:MAG: hypothetical protein RLZZ444_4205 [Pseudomonadota bacterium]|jgi:DNA-nicking Smr family endonuclease